MLIALVWCWMLEDRMHGVIWLQLSRPADTMGPILVSMQTRGRVQVAPMFFVALSLKGSEALAT